MFETQDAGPSVLVTGFIKAQMFWGLETRVLGPSRFQGCGVAPPS